MAVSLRGNVAKLAHPLASSTRSDQTARLAKVELRVRPIRVRHVENQRSFALLEAFRFNNRSYPYRTDTKVRVYSPETVIAEKFQTMVALGRANSRIKDIFDVWSLFNAHEIDPIRMADALGATFGRRNTLLPEVTPDGLTPAFGEDPSKIRQWRAFVDGLGTEPPPLVDVLADLATHLMPLTERARALARPA